MYPGIKLDKSETNLVFIYSLGLPMDSHLPYMEHRESTGSPHKESLWSPCGLPVDSHLPYMEPTGSPQGVQGVHRESTGSPQGVHRNMWGSVKCRDIRRIIACTTPFWHLSTFQHIAFARSILHRNFLLNSVVNL